MLHLEPAIAVAGWRIAALCEQGRAAHALPGALFATVHKRPLAILLSRGGELSAWAPDGSRLAPSAVERLCPGAIAAFVAAAPRDRRPGRPAAGRA